MLQAHLFLPNNKNKKILVAIEGCDFDINSVVPKARVLDPYSSTEFIFTVTYRTPLMLPNRVITCYIVVRNSYLMVIAKRRYVYFDYQTQQHTELQFLFCKALKPHISRMIYCFLTFAFPPSQIKCFNASFSHVIGSLSENDIC